MRVAIRGPGKNEPTMNHSKIDRAKAQNAHHYCLEAMGQESGARDNSRNLGHFEAGKIPSRTDWLRNAHRVAIEAGILAGNKPRKLADAAALLEAIVSQSRAAGIDSYTGETFRPCEACGRQCSADGWCAECGSPAWRAEKAAKQAVAPAAQPEVWEVRVISHQADLGRSRYFSNRTFGSSAEASKAIDHLPRWCKLGAALLPVQVVG